MHREYDLAGIVIGCAIEVHCHLGPGLLESADIHKQQVMTYLKLTGTKVGLIINFNVMVLTHGIKRIFLPLTLGCSCFPILDVG